MIHLHDIYSLSQIVHAGIEDRFMELWSSFQTRYQTYYEALKYLGDTWISPHKERFVAAWTNNVMHFGHAVISRGESAHSRLKRTWARACLICCNAASEVRCRSKVF